VQALVLVTMVLSTINAYAGWQERLSETQIQSLELAVINSLPTSRQANKRIISGTSTDAYQAPLNREVLLVELQEVKSRSANTPRIAEVFVYDYIDNEASVVYVDVDSQAIIDSKKINHIHLPLNDREIDAAVSWLVSDASLLDTLAEEYEKQIGRSLDSLEQIDMKVSIWNPSAVYSSSHACHATRCALVSLFTHSNYNFSIEPVVNLSTGLVDLEAVK